MTIKINPISNYITDLGLRSFVQDNIDPLVDQAMAFPQESARILTEINGTIATASLIFEHAKDDIKVLSEKQKELFSRPAPIPNPHTMKDLAPVGIPNASNNCWANSILQMLVNAPNIAQKILDQGNGSCKVLASLVRRYYRAQLATQKVANKVDSQKLRTSIPSISANKTVQIAVCEVMEKILDTIGFQYHFKQESSIEYAKGNYFLDENCTTFRDEPIIQLDLSNQDNSFENLFSRFFSFETERKYNGQTVNSRVKLKFDTSPNDLIIQAKRSIQNGRVARGQVANGTVALKNKTNIKDVPVLFELPVEFTEKKEENVLYELTSCIVHIGDDKGGHYVSLEKKPDGWYLTNDTCVTKVSDQETQRLLQQGIFYHYSKVGQMPESPQAPVMLPPVAVIAAPSMVRSAPIAEPLIAEEKVVARVIPAIAQVVVESPVATMGKRVSPSKGSGIVLKTRSSPQVGWGGWVINVITTIAMTIFYIATYPINTLSEKLTQKV